MKKTTDFDPYVNTLPYASEIFGVYQPLLGWRSKRMRGRIEAGYRLDRKRLIASLNERFRGRPDFPVTGEKPTQAQIRSLISSTPRDRNARPIAGHVLESVRAELPPADKYDEAVWGKVLDRDRLAKVLETEVVPRTVGRGTAQRAEASHLEALGQESASVGLLLYLKENKHFDLLKEIFYKHDGLLQRLPALLKFKDPLDLFDPFKDLARVSLSPIGVVHLFRQYFFELDTFLGPSVSHVWLSPGSSVELVEISTRRTLVERTTEMFEESIVKSEKATTEEDEVSDAVKEDNRSETKFGMNATVNQGWVSGSATASASIDMSTTQSKARETTHRHMRQQTEKLSTEIRKNYKATFKTVTETTDTSSKRYVLANSTQELINYEMRRKMRHVGVQVQDIGTYLCWQTYVDDPGRQLGISELVHIAKDPEIADVPPPEAIPMPVNVVTEHPIDIPFVPVTEDTVPEDDMDEVYRNGWEVNTDFADGDSERVKAYFSGFVAEIAQPGYQYSKKPIEFDYGGNDVQLSPDATTETAPGRVKYAVSVDHINFHNVSPVRVTAKVTWEPTQAVRDEINTKNLEKADEFAEKTKREFEKAFVEAARERIVESSKIVSRKFEDLREEERIVVYRMLIQDMLMKDIPLPDDRTRHVVAELLNTIFDIDKMLYFVAPEWWRPRLHASHQSLGGIRPGVGGEAVSDEIEGVDTVSWGGGGAQREDNYFITEESEPAKLGSSLGWLLQLDGDNMRNAFLNAPWVKAVIPVRPGKERAAINWLQRVNVEGSEGLDDDYVAPADQLAEIPHSGPKATIRDAIDHLCDLVARKHEQSSEVAKFPPEEINDDNKVMATPIDRVYEHGFYPLQGGFRVKPEGEEFELFDQWVEVLPTDQVVPVEVTYDPKTGRQV